jgi:SNF2 family DNA or RNA helicase
MSVDILPKQGDIVSVRTRQYLVEGVKPSPGEHTLVSLSCLEDDAQGVPLEVLWEAEVDAQLSRGDSWTRVADHGFDDPRKFSAYLHALRWNTVTATNPKLFQAPYRAGIKVDAYQLEPLRKALLLPRVNLFIADDVGLGKTIEAGLIVRELLIRQKVRRIVIAAPPSVALQWRDEMDSRFGLTFVVLDRDYVMRQRRERGFGVNPWTTHTRFIVSHALLRDESYAASLRDWLGDFSPASLLILDEAHNAAPASGSRYGVDSDFTKAVRQLAPRFEHRLFLSATPHNGHSNSFAALLEILDPQRFCRGVPVKNAKLLDAVMVRRLKEDLRKMVGGLPERKVEEIVIDGLPADAPELQLAELLAEYKEAKEARLKTAPRSVQNSSGLVLSHLQTRLLSSIEAFARTLHVHRESVERHLTAVTEPSDGGARTFPLLVAPDANDEASELTDEELSQRQDVQLRAATARGSSAADRSAMGPELDLLERMTDVSNASRGVADARVIKLIAWIKEHMCAALGRPGAVWNNRRVLIFTEWTDTKRYLEQQLRGAIQGSDRAGERIDTFHARGDMGDEKYEAVKRAFNGDPAEYPLRILIATEAAREGVNLQNNCYDLFHFDVPWNPSRMEQRNGRIDRKLQRAPVVFCRYFRYAQRPEDIVLRALIRKTETIREQLGSLSPILESRLSARLKDGIDRRRVTEQAVAIEQERPDATERQTVDEELEAVREREMKLQQQLDTLRDLLKTSKDWLGLSEPSFRDAISCALEMSGARPLEDGASAPKGPHEYRLPVDALGPNWQETLDTLRTPRRPDQKLWEWRRDAPIHPVIFEDAGSLDAAAVHLHLEHRVVQRLMGRFLAQGFVYHDLSRACFGQSRDPLPRAVLLGRLSLYGQNAARLHDEIIAVATRWVDPAARKGALQPFADEATERATEMLDTALEASAGAAIDPVVQKRLLGAVPHDVEDLLPHLQARAKAAGDKARERLAERGVREADEMRGIIEAQRKRILDTAAKADVLQRRLDFDNEKRQLEADKRHWQRRLAAIEDELQHEPNRIRDTYQVTAERIEPVGIVYLWPTTG